MKRMGKFTEKVNLLCKISQLVKLFKNGQPFKMSKRKGDYITVEDLIKYVGRDSARFMMLNRSNDAELDFDFENGSKLEFGSRFEFEFEFELEFCTIVEEREAILTWEERNWGSKWGGGWEDESWEGNCWKEALINCK